MSEKIKKNITYEPPVEVLVERLDDRYLGFIIIDNLGGGRHRNFLICANVELTTAIIKTIKRNIHRLGANGERLTTIRLKQRVEGVIVTADEISTPEKRQLIFDNVKQRYDAVQEAFHKSLRKSTQVVSSSVERIDNKVKEFSLGMGKDFQKQIAQITTDIMLDRDKATLFACMEQYDDVTCDHSLRVFLVGTKLISKLYNPIPGPAIKHSKKIMQYAIGLLFHDVGKLFVPSHIMNKSTKLTKIELEEIKRKLIAKNLGTSLYDMIARLSDPKSNWTSDERDKIQGAVESMKKLIDLKVLTTEQYDMLCVFSHRGCLSDEETTLINRHPMWGWEVIKSSPFSSDAALDIIRHHHEKLDGSGYPDQITNMSIEVQIASISDIFDVMVSERSYKNAVPYDVAFRLLKEMTIKGPNGLPKLSEEVYDLFCRSIQKYPVGSFIEVVGGQFDGYIGQVTKFTPGPHTENCPEFVLFKDSAWKRMDRALSFSSDNYGGRFTVRGLPFTPSFRQLVLFE